MALSEEQIKQFYDEGYLIIPDFADEGTIERLRSECRRLVDEMDPDEITTVFTTQEWLDETRMQGKTEISKVQSWELAASIGMVDPIVCQSMYIFKPPKIGGAVNPHQDSCFLNTKPMKLVGFWLALEDTTEDNGCLWFIPKSHKDGLHGDRRFVRIPKNKLPPGEPETKFVGEMVEYEHCKFVAGPVKKGTMVLIHGEVVHKSEKNVSDKSREIYTFHMYDQHNVEYNTESWLQPSETFQRLFA